MKKYIGQLGLLLLLACNNSTQLTGIDKERWAEDPNGCKGLRMEMYDDLKKNLENIKGSTQTELVELLGKPDMNELYKRSQKFFIYHLSPHKSCNSDTTVTDNVYLSIRFNAMGLAKEVLIYNE